MSFQGVSLRVYAALLCIIGAVATPLKNRIVASPPAHTATTEDFHAFVKQYDRSYEQGTSEFEDRRVLFNQRVAEVRKLNDRPRRLWTAGINKLSDRTEVELAELRGWRGAASTAGSAQPQFRLGGGTFLKQSSRAKPVPKEFMNWTKLSTTNNVLDQGACGSCWAVTTTTVLQAHAEIYVPAQKRTFSTQELVSCVPNPHSCGGDGGCKGATVELALHYVMRHGIASATEDPYTALTGSCSRKSNNSMLGSTNGAEDDDVKVDDISKPGLHVALSASPSLHFGMRGWERLPENKYEPLLRAVFERGPVAVSVAASAWSSYLHGIFDHCSKDAVIDHAVTLIGFGEGFGSDGTSKEMFWIIQNSWGPDWGEQGKIRLLRKESDDVDQCGIDKQPEVGTACKGGPKEVKVCGMCGVLYDSVVPHFTV